MSWVPKQCCCTYSAEAFYKQGHVPSESAWSRPVSEKGHMYSNCCAIAVIRLPVHVCFLLIM